MPSPFPGMNPWLEQDDVWEDFHSRYLPAIAAQLARGVGTSYFVKIEQQLYIHESSAEERALLGRADVGIAQVRPAESAQGSAGTRRLLQISSALLLCLTRIATSSGSALGIG